MQKLFENRILRLLITGALAVGFYFICPKCLDKKYLIGILALLFVLINAKEYIARFVPLTWVARIAVGALFIFSGVIKANDPVGFSYKLEEYFEVFHMPFLVPLALPKAIFLVAFEIILGALLLLGLYTKTVTRLLLAMILFFTFLTFFSACYNKVTTCGCFGDFLVLKPWESFWKDIVLLFLIVLVLIGEKNIQPVVGPLISTILALLIVVGSFAFPLYTYNNLPIWDFRAYKVGTNLINDMKVPDGPPGKFETLLYYRNTKTGEVKEFTLENYPWQDTLTWKWDTTITKTIIEPPQAKIKDFAIMDMNGSDYTQDILNHPGYHFFLVAYDLDKTDKKVFGRIKDFVSLCDKDSIPFIGLTASGGTKISEFRHDTQAMFDFYNTDGIALKTMIRSNPGLVLLNGPTVVAMWHYRNFPSYTDVKAEYFK